MKPLDSTLHTHFKSLGIESLSDSNVQDNIKNIYSPGVFNALTRRLKTLFGPRIAAQFNVTSQVSKKTTDWLDQQSYLTVGDVTVYIPKGLSVTYLEYLETLEYAFESLKDIEADLLRPALNTILILRNNPSMLQAASGVSNQKVKEGVVIEGRLFDVDLSEIIAKLAATKTQANKTDTMKYSKAFQRNADFDATVVRQLALQDGIIQINPDKIKKLTAQLFEESTKLANDMNTDPLYANVSKANSTMLASMLFTVAQWVEFLGVYASEIIVSSQAIGDTVKKLEKISKA